MAMAVSVVSCSVGFSASSLVSSSSGNNGLQASPSVSCPTKSYGYPSVFCGRGDKRTAKGKRFRSSFGNSRPKNKDKGRGLPAIPLPPRPSKKDPFEDGEKIEIDIEETMLN